MTQHVASLRLKQRVADLARAGTPKHLIARIIDIDEETLNKHYAYQLTCSKSEAIEQISNTVFNQAINGNEKSQALYLKTQGSGQGWVEKQVVENVSGEETLALKEKIAELEGKYVRDY